MDVLDLYGSNFALPSTDPIVNICGGGNRLCIYQPDNRDMKIRDALEYLKEQNPNTKNWVIFQDSTKHFSSHPVSIIHAVVDGKCLKSGELTEEVLTEVFHGIPTIVVDDGVIEKLAASYNPQYCK